MSRSRAIILVTVLLVLAGTAALVLLLVSTGTQAGPRLRWQHTYLPGGPANAARNASDGLALAGDQAVLEGTRSPAPALYDFGGKLLWQFPLPQAGEEAYFTAFGPDRTVVVGTGQSRVISYDTSGKLRWVFDVPGPHTNCQPSVGADGTVYVVSTDHVLYAIDPTGRLKWSSAIAQLMGFPPPTVTGDTLYGNTKQYALVAIGLDGKERWRTQDSTAEAGPPLLFGSGLVVCVRRDDGKVSAFDASGKLTWSFSYRPPQDSGPGSYARAAADLIYLPANAARSSEIIALDASGKVRWRRPYSEALSRADVAATGELWMLSEPNDLAPARGNGANSSHWAPGTKYTSASIYVFDEAGNVAGPTLAPFAFTVSSMMPLPDGSMLVLGSNGELCCYAR